jgi:RHS repeat-associated protein
MIETLTVENGSAPSPITSRYRFQLDNHLGTVAVETDDAGAVISFEEYHPYGTSAYRAMKSGVEVSAKRYRYTGKEKDEETKLYLMGARYYAAWLARWTAADPAGTVDGTNLYAYVRGSPVGLVDPSGTQSRGELAQRREAIQEQVKHLEWLARSEGGIQEWYADPDYEAEVEEHKFLLHRLAVLDMQLAEVDEQAARASLGQIESDPRTAAEYEGDQRATDLKNMGIEPVARDVDKREVALETAAEEPLAVPFVAAGLTAGAASEALGASKETADTIVWGFAVAAVTVSALFFGGKKARRGRARGRGPSGRPKRGFAAHSKTQPGARTAKVRKRVLQKRRRAARQQLAWRKKVKIGPGETADELYANRKMRVEEFIAQHRRGSVKGVLPEAAKSMTVEEALRKGEVGDVNVKKLLTSKRKKFRKR